MTTIEIILKQHNSNSLSINARKQFLQMDVWLSQNITTLHKAYCSMIPSNILVKINNFNLETSTLLHLLWACDYIQYYTKIHKLKKAK